MERQLAILISALIAGILAALFSGLGLLTERKKKASKLKPETFWKLSTIFSILFAILAFLYATIT